MKVPVSAQYQQQAKIEKALLQQRRRADANAESARAALQQASLFDDSVFVLSYGADSDIVEWIP